MVFQMTSSNDGKEITANSGYDERTSPPRGTLWYRFVLRFGKMFVLPFIYRSYNVEVEGLKEKIRDPSLIVYNHTCNFDQFGVIKGAPPYKRYIASDALVRTFGYRLAFFLVNDFIFRRKGERGDNVIRSAKASIEKGVHVCMAPEGGESLNGVSSPIRPRTGEMVKEMNCGLVTIRLEGGYFIKPSWAMERSTTSPMRGGVVNVYSREEVAEMSAEEINEVMRRDLYINHYDWQRKLMIPSDRPNRAEFMEFVLYVCPRCKQIGRLHSKGDFLNCECGCSLEVDEYGFFKGDDAVYDNLYDWDVWQRHYIAERMGEWRSEPEKPFFIDDGMRFEVLKDNKPEVIEDSVSLQMSPSGIRVIGEKTDLMLPIDRIRAITVAHRQDTAVIFDDKYYQFVPPIPSSPQKYKTAFYILRGDDCMRF